MKQDKTKSYAYKQWSVIMRYVRKVWGAAGKLCKKVWVAIGNASKKKWVLIGAGCFAIAAVCLIVVLTTIPATDTIAQSEPVSTPASTVIQTPVPEEAPQPTVTPKQIQDRYVKKHNENNDMVAWIQIENTRIDYPVVQTQDNEFYLDKDFSKNQSKSGTIFLDSLNDLGNIGSPANLVVYGHHMKDGSMFENLMKYKEEAFFIDNPTIAFNTLYEDFEWEIFSLYVTPVSFNYIDTTFLSEASFKKFLGACKEKSMYDTGVVPSKNDTILTLSTCTYEYDNARFVVQARLKKHDVSF